MNLKKEVNKFVDTFSKEFNDSMYKEIEFVDMIRKSISYDDNNVDLDTFMRFAFYDAHDEAFKVYKHALNKYLEKELKKVLK